MIVGVACPEFDEPVGSYLDRVLEALAGHLGHNLHATYVYGSLATGTFISGKSDVDTCAVTRTAPSFVQKRALIDALSHDTLPCPEPRLEFVLYNLEAVATASQGPGFDVNLNTGCGTATHATVNPDEEPAHWFVIDRAICRE